MHNVFVVASIGIGAFLPILWFWKMRDAGLSFSEYPVRKEVRKDEEV